MVRIAEAHHRLFDNVFFAKQSKVRSDSNRVRNKQVKRESAKANLCEL